VAAALRLGPRDLDRTLGLVAEAAATDGSQPFELSLIERLVDLLPAEVVGYFEYQEGGSSLYWVSNEPDCTDWDGEVKQAALPSWPLHDGRWAGRAQGAVSLGDVVTRAGKRRNAWYAEVMRPLSIEHEVKIWLPAPPGVVRGFFATRCPGSRDFDHRDLTILTVLRQHLAGIRERWERRHRPPGLTDREAEVVRLLREGLTNREIADRLVIATSTVRTHLENVFEKLGVHTRTAAVAKLSERGRSRPLVEPNG